jgi:uncharacterized membrane protein YfcA
MFPRSFDLKFALLLAFAILSFVGFLLGLHFISDAQLLLGFGLTLLCGALVHFLTRALDAREHELDLREMRG